MARYPFPPKETAESIATALTIRSGSPVRPDQVQIEPRFDLGSGKYLVTVYESANAATQVIPYYDDPTPVDLKAHCFMGLQSNRKPYKMNPWQHGQLIGATTSGKSSLAHCILAHCTKCPLCSVWVGGMWKLYDFVAGWIEPYLNTGLKPPIEWIAHGHQDVCNMLASALDVADYRMSIRMDKRAHLPMLMIILDEVTYIVRDRNTKAFANGSWMNSSQLIGGISTGTAGAGIFELLATQRDTIDMFGDQGGTVTAQMGFSAVFRIRDFQTIGRVFGNDKYNLAIPTMAGEYWLDPGPLGDLLKLRAAHIQPADPTKWLDHDGDNVRDIAWSRRHIDRGLEPGSAEAAGEHFANRHKLVTDEMIEYLTTKPRQSAPAPVGTGSVGDFGDIMSPALAAEMAAAEAEVIRIMNANGNLDTSASGSTNGYVSEAVSKPTLAIQEDISTYRTRVDKVKAIIRGRTTANPIGRSEIIAILRDGGDPVPSDQSVTDIVGKLIRPAPDGTPPEFGRTEDNLYYAL